MSGVLRRGVFIVAVVALATILGGAIGWYVSPPFPWHLRASLVDVERGESEAFSPVSMTRLDADRFAIANYRNIYIWDRSRREAYAVAPLDVPVWNPTAVQYTDGLLYIANYTGGDVLIASINEGERISLDLVERIVHPDGTAGPEGIHVVGGQMAVADYVGNAASYFERVDGEWQFRWRAPVPAAHGISLNGDFVFAGGFGVIAKFDRHSGEELARITQYEEGRPVRFATCVNHDAVTDGIVGSDTIAGMVFRLDRDLNVIEHFGENGPGHEYLSMPYCAYRNADGVLRVLSTYQERIIEIGERTRSYVFWPEKRWQRLVEWEPGSVELFGGAVSPGYSSIRLQDGTSLVMPVRAPLLAVSGDIWPYYQVSLGESANRVAIVANSSPIVLLYNREDQRFYGANIGQWDCWAIQSRIECPGGSVEIDSLDQQPIDDRVIEAEITTLTAEQQPAYYLDYIVGGAAPLLEYWAAWHAVHGNNP